MSLQKQSIARPGRGLFLGWWIVASGFVFGVLHSGLLSQAFGAYFVHFQADFGWSRTTLAGSFSLMQLESGLVAPVQGWLIDRWGPRAILRVGTVIFGIGFMLLSTVHSTVTFYGAFSVIAIGSSFAGWITINVTVANWFQRKRSTAMGLVSAGDGVGGLMVPIVAWTLAQYSWRTTALATGIVIILVGLPVAQWIRSSPEKYGLAPDGELARETGTRGAVSGTGHRALPAPDGADTGFTAWQAIHSSAFWLIGLGHAFAVVVVSAVSVHLIPHLVEQQGKSVQWASMVLAVMTVLILVGQIGGGLLADRVDKRLLACLAMVGHALGMLALGLGSSMLWIMAFVVLHGVAWGVRGPLMSTIRADYFGRKAFGSIMGLSALLVMAGSLTGPLVAASLADYSGDYQLAFTLLAALAGLGTLFFIAARKPKPPLVYSLSS